MAQVLSGASLALLLVRLLHCRPPSHAADRGFHGRPSHHALDAGDHAMEGTGPQSCPILYPWSDGRQDLQLGLLLMLIASCSNDVGSLAEFGVEAVSQQVGALVELDCVQCQHWLCCTSTECKGLGGCRAASGR